MAMDKGEGNKNRSRQWIPGKAMKDEPIYYINQYSVLKHPKIWSRRDYWMFQIVSVIACIPLLILVLFLLGPPLSSFLVVLAASSAGAIANIRQGRRRAERYKYELANGITSPYLGKYSFEETRFFLGM
jgi:hypothetical protein